MRRLLVLMAIVALIPAAAAAKTLTETIDRTYDVKPGATLELENVNGRISVGSWDQARVRVIARKEVDADRDEAAQMLRELRVDIQQHAAGVRVTTRPPKRSEGFSSIFDWLLGEHVRTQVTYEVTVPRQMNVEVSNTNGGIQLAGVNGRLELDTTNGKITVERCGGSLNASTTNGGIDAELLAVASGQALRFETTNGRIELALPADLKADLDAGTTNGAIRTDLPVATTNLGRTSLRGKINGGGTPIRLRTTNGGIAIRVAGKS